MQKVIPALRVRSQLHYDDFDLRMAALHDLASAFRPIEDRLWQTHSEITPRAAAYARRNKHAFEHLRSTGPWCSVMEEFGDA